MHNMPITDYERFEAISKWITRHYHDIREHGYAAVLEGARAAAPEPEEAAEPPTPEEIAKQEQIKRMQEVLKRSSFGCQQSNVVELFGIMLGDDLKAGLPEDDPSGLSDDPTLSREAEYYWGLAIVPLEDGESHSYPLNRVTIMRGANRHGDRGCRVGTRDYRGMGNYFLSGGLTRGQARLATEEEITQWFAEVREAQSRENGTLVRMEVNWFNHVDSSALLNLSVAHATGALDG